MLGSVCLDRLTISDLNFPFLNSLGNLYLMLFKLKNQAMWFTLKMLQSVCVYTVHCRIRLMYY